MQELAQDGRMSMATYAGDRKIRWLLVTITLVAFPVALLIFAFSGCDVRLRSEKKACRGGELARCLEVGKFYEDRADGILGFLMSNADTAVAYYHRACKLKS